MKTTTKLNNIQVLRAFAAVTVVLFHTGFAFPYLRPFGSFGVDVFFVISGYIMARILDPQSDSSSDHFFRRRVLRIVPPYWFFTLLLFGISFAAPQLMGATRADWVDLVKSLLFIPFTKGSGLIQPLLFLGWSLNYEMFFYVALAIGLLLHKRYATWIGGGLVVAVLVATAPFTQQSVLAQFYSRDVSLEFLLGILAYYLCRAVPDSLSRRMRIPALVACFSSAILLIAIQAAMPHPPPHMFLERFLILGLPAFVLITSASLLSQGGWDSNLTWLVLVGDASYILYLIHPYCEYSIDRILGTRANFHWLRSATAPGAFIGVSLSIVIAILLHIYAERPTVRYLNRHFGGKRKSTEFPAAS